jgi:hypothetical protein
MTNTVVLNEFFIWEEKNLIEPKMKSKNNGVIDQEDITKNIRTLNESENWKDITDPKLREKAYNKAYREANKDKIELKRKEYQQVNKDKIKLQQKLKYTKHKKKILKKCKVYRELNKNKIKEYQHNYRPRANVRLKERLKSDIHLKLKVRLRKRFWQSLKHSYKSGSAVKDLGCTVEELKTYLENKFQPGMTWDNYGYYGWHIDHIKPLATFDLTNREQWLEACHYTNLQPLWAKDNLSKGDKVL